MMLHDTVNRKLIKLTICTAQLLIGIGHDENMNIDNKSQSSLFYAKIM